MKKMTVPSRFSRPVERMRLKNCVVLFGISLTIAECGFRIADLKKDENYAALTSRLCAFARTCLTLEAPGAQRLIRIPHSEIRNRLDDVSFVRRFQLVADAAPDDAAREGCGERVVEEERRRRGPEQEVRPHARAQLRVVVFEHERDGVQAEKRFPDSEREDDADDRERPRERKSQRGARERERESAEEDDDKKKVRPQHEAPQVRRIDARDLQLPRREFKQLAERAVFDRRVQARGHEAYGQPRFSKRARQRVVIRARAAPALSNVQTLERLAPHGGRAAPAEVSSV